MKKIVLILVAVVVAAALINDVGRYARARHDLSVIGQDTADNIAMGSKETSRDTNAAAAAAYAASRGATVYLYDQDEQQVYVWIELPVEGTWVLARYNAWKNGEPQGTPMKIQLDNTSRWK